ncbi:hypothetical protein AB0I28_16945 [Phytomonospora sp. NPDC050363]|uniref:hypothetical protein n=1 Tax=Phytomonospora sp. NPDC050363 TaxID=3155642 RepID=UPI0033D22476
MSKATGAKTHALWAFWTLVLAAAGTALIQGVSKFAGKDLGVWYVFGTLLLVLILRRVIRAVRSPRDAEIPAAPRLSDPSVLVARRPFADVGRWENRMSWASGDPERFERAVLVKLREVVDERLRQRHGVTMTTSPTRASSLMGRELWQFLYRPLAATPTPAQLDWYIARIEEI